MVQFRVSEIGHEAWNTLSLIEETDKLDLVYKKHAVQIVSVESLLAARIIKCTLCPEHVAASGYRVHWASHADENQIDANAAALLNLLERAEADVAANMHRDVYVKDLKTYMAGLTLDCLFCGGNVLALDFAVHWNRHLHIQNPNPNLVAGDVQNVAQNVEQINGDGVAEENPEAPVLLFPLAEIGQEAWDVLSLIIETNKLDLVFKNHAFQIDSMKSVLAAGIINCSVCPDRIDASGFRLHWANHVHQDPVIDHMDATAANRLHFLEGAEADLAFNKQRDDYMKDLRMYIAGIALICLYCLDIVSATLFEKHWRDHRLLPLFSDEYPEPVGFNPFLQQIVDEYGVLLSHADNVAVANQLVNQEVPPDDAENEIENAAMANQLVNQEVLPKDAENEAENAAVANQLVNQEVLPEDAENEVENAAVANQLVNQEVLPEDAGNEIENAAMANQLVNQEAYVFVYRVKFVCVFCSICYCLSSSLPAQNVIENVAMANQLVNQEVLPVPDQHLAVPFNHQCLVCLHIYGLIVGSANVRDLRLHRRAGHMQNVVNNGVVDPTTFRCRHCDYVGSYKGTSIHLPFHHPPQRHVCPFPGCPMVFDNHWELNAHNMNAHQ